MKNSADKRAVIEAMILESEQRIAKLTTVVESATRELNDERIFADQLRRRYAVNSAATGETTQNHTVAEAARQPAEGARAQLLARLSRDVTPSDSIQHAVFTVLRNARAEPDDKVRAAVIAEVLMQAGVTTKSRRGMVPQVSGVVSRHTDKVEVIKRGLYRLRDAALDPTDGNHATPTENPR